MGRGNGIRSNKFSIVIHDVQPEVKVVLETSVQAIFNPKWSLVALEEYNHQEGYHLHLFLEFDRSHFVAKSTVLKKIINLNLGGRVQCDYGKGSFDQCEKYLQGATKQKKIDENISCYISRKGYALLLKEYSDSVPLFHLDDQGRIRPTPFEFPSELVARGTHFSIRLVEDPTHVPNKPRPFPPGSKLAKFFSQD